MKKLLVILLFIPLFTRAQVIVTVAGNGHGGYSGDGHAATAAELNGPYGVALDDSGNLYICDYLNNCIRKVSPGYGGVITTIAGNGTSGYSGDHGLGIFAQIGGVSDIAIDHNGNVYIPDGAVLRKVTPADTITTIAGTGVAGYNGDGIPATAAQLNGASSIAVDSIGNLYFTDGGSYRIRKIDTGGIITTIAGTGIAGFSPDGSRADTSKLNIPYGVKIDKAGNIFYEDSARIRKIDVFGIITTVAGNGVGGFSGDSGLATAAELVGGAIAIDSIGNLYIADAGSSRIREINIAGIINTIAGGGTGSSIGDGGDPLFAELCSPQGVAVNKFGDVYIGDVCNDRIRLVTKHPLDVSFDKFPEGRAGMLTGLQVYPNPCNRTFKLICRTNTEEQMKVIITNIIGEKIKDISTATNQLIEIKLDVPHGIYYLSATTEKNSFYQKIIIDDFITQ